MNKNFCKNQEVLSAYLDGMLPEERKSRVKGHVESCPECSQIIREMEAIRRLLAEYPEKDPGVGFETAVLNQVKERGLPVSFRNWSRRISYSLGGLALFLIILVLVQRPSIQPPLEKDKSLELSRMVTAEKENSTLPATKPEISDKSVVLPGEVYPDQKSVKLKTEKQEVKQPELASETAVKKETARGGIALKSTDGPAIHPAPQNIVIRNKKDWEGIWLTQNLTLPLPKVDFRKQMVIAVPSIQNGQEYQVIKTEEKENLTIVYYQVIPLNKDTAQTILPPYQIKIVNTQPIVEFQQVK